ncbi:MAG: hypothetical protein L0211_09675 [Planctomycetaceae bacterium]|nr:hypothetical protein [Planctomycetaceae bacterium]
MSLLRFRPFAGLLAVALFAAGCRPHDEIARYTVPKPELIDPTLVRAAAEERQMLGAIVLVDKAGWFFKLTGAKAQVGPLWDPFVSFVKDISFEGRPAEPKWKLPPGWKEQPGNEFRFATLVIPSDGKALELTVTTLELGEVSEVDYLLANINRWRGQIGLDELKASDLATESITTKVGGYPCTLVNMVGTGSGAMPAGPFAGGPFASGSAPFASADGPSTPRPSSSADQPTWTRPDGWTEIPPKAFGIAAFSVGEDPKKVEITLSSAGGDWTANVNRWRGQLSLSPVGPAEIAKEVQQIDVLGVKGNYIQLTGASKEGEPMTLFGVAATVDGTQYFIKLTGNPELAQREKANFEAFVKSLKFE